MIGLVATAAALAVWTFGGAGITALDWSVYDRWLRAHPVAPASPELVLIVRDPASEARFGAGAWDRAVLARMVTSLARAGAIVIGVDVPLGRPDGPGPGGAVGDALLGEATAMAGTVVYPLALEPGRTAADAGDRTERAHRSWPMAVTPRAAWLEATPVARTFPGLAQHAKGLGHLLAPAEADGVVRKAPVFVRVHDRPVPALALALLAAFVGAGADAIALDAAGVVVHGTPERGGVVRIPTDPRGRALIEFAGSALPQGVQVVPFSEAWAAVESRRTGGLSSLVDERLVLVMVEPGGGGHPTPVGVLPSVGIQAHLLNRFLTGAGLRGASLVQVALETVVLATLAAWLWLAWPWWGALIGVTALAAIHTVAVPLVLTAGVVRPLWPALTALAAASVAGLGIAHFLSVYRVRRLESENARVRHTLVRHESAVESLEEDLEAARVAIARSTGVQRDLAGAAEALRIQLAEARTQEESTRRQLAGLERELRGLRPAALPVDARGGVADDECAALGIVTRDAGLLALFEDVKKGARGSLPILLLGEPGTGKELFARAAHALSLRASRPFVAVNMAAIPPELFESALFGHVRGSFTGAVADRKGYFAEADGGTIFLDEIGELRLEHQGKLLRVLQEKSFHRVGASRATAVDVRVLAASNRDLERGIADGWFREDLYFRLKGLVLRLPPLRDRIGDVPLLAAHLVADIAAEAGRPELALSEEAVAALEAHDWPGNVRELENVLRQAVLLADGPTVTAKDLRLSPRTPPAGRRSIEPDIDPDSDAAVLAALRHHRFDMQATARALGWDRSTVTQRLKGLGFRALIEAGGDHGKAALRLAGESSLARTVEMKLREYHEHLLRSVRGFDAADSALVACRRRFKNLPERHFRFLEVLVRQHFDLR